MKYAQIKQLAKALKNQGAINKSFSLNQKADILIAEIKENITKVDRKNISPELAAILLDFTILAINYKPEAAKTPQKTTKKAAKSTKNAENKEKEMTQEEFNIKFATLYVEIRKEEELDFVVTLRKPKIEKRFIAAHGISINAYRKMYEKVPTLFEIPENGQVMCRITTKKQADGTYRPGN